MTLDSQLNRKPICIVNSALNIDENWRTAKKQSSGSIDVIDFFSGCGGMSAGFKSINGVSPTYRIAMAVDTDADANATYQENLGVAPNQLDVANLAKEIGSSKALINQMRQSDDAPLVMIGCSPCQGFSSHRNSGGLTDIRNSLFVSFARIAAEVQPDAIIMENVPELLTDRYWPLVAEAKQLLERAGYNLQISIHDMAEFGVPQHRFRALLVGTKCSFQLPKGFLSRESFRTVRHAIENLEPVEPGKTCASDPMHKSAGHKASTIDTIKSVPLDGGSRPADAGPECLRRAAAKQGRAAYEDVYGRLWWDRPAITMTAYSRNPASGRYVHPEQHRGLTVREAALLQGFPSDYNFLGGFDSKFRQIGNAVPPTFAAALAAHIANTINGLENFQLESETLNVIGPVGPSFSRLIPSIKAGHNTIQSALRSAGTVAA